MKAPSASRCASHGSLTTFSRSACDSHPSLTSVPRSVLHAGTISIVTVACETAGPGVPGPAAHLVLLGGAGGRPRGLAVALDRGQGSGRLEHVLGELALAGQQLLGEVVGVRAHVLRPG